ncbi:hypothetical protein A3A09_01215 [Candidatus Nomurabacteria bacterium RIFCSPLOWO2_01_FULL_42_20]|uniref:Uncharacterized protein n=1 Tax=Candidatus Nomurabacteria bacterium RIFCSPHIGHO2_01_FULL_42_16 TaxID=1801743 RepID=A0A1F6VLQ9_9BACT|nr:MAG: hypothetical protein A2824_00255 [Candidatus Nomurabacteria bacterium RIFCSPHIGHO2_01_FULL_42_16]OGI92622.1 MAG: hypothetical protein A3A09_01215 [Candidatus Nomurabacteria bacterium RIFCSPLOWO2_01_FULL_42_20]
MEKKIKNLLLGFSMMVSFAGIAAMVFYARKGEMAAIIDVAKKFLIKFLEENQGSIMIWTAIALGGTYIIYMFWQILTLKEEEKIEKYPA